MLSHVFINTRMLRLFFGNMIEWKQFGFTFYLEHHYCLNKICFKTGLPPSGGSSRLQLWSRSQIWVGLHVPRVDWDILITNTGLVWIKVTAWEFFYYLLPFLGSSWFSPDFFQYSNMETCLHSPVQLPTAEWIWVTGSEKRSEIN